MTKTTKICLIILGAIGLFGLLSVVIDNNPNREENVKNLLNEENKVITMKVSELSNTGLTLTIVNNTNKYFIYGNPFSLSIRENDGWIPVQPLIDYCMFTMEGLILKPDQRVERKYRWDHCYGILPSGEYRISKSFNHITTNIDSWTGDDLGIEYLIWTEFVI